MPKISNFLQNHAHSKVAPSFEYMILSIKSKIPIDIVLQPREKHANLMFHQLIFRKYFFVQIWSSLLCTRYRLL